MIGHKRNRPPQGTSLGIAMSLFALAISIGCNSQQAGRPAPPMPVVTVAAPIQQQIVEWDAYTGRLEPVEFVEVRARVGGYLKSIHFTEGQIVNRGELLFVIDPRPYEVEMESANAAMTRAQSQLKQAEAGLAEAHANQHQSDAQVDLADARVKRTRNLADSRAVSREEVDQAEAEYLQAKADSEATGAAIASAKATIETAKGEIESAQAGISSATLNLQYTRVQSPLTGRISREYANVGNLISGGTATATMLTTITSVDPIYCTFDASEQDVLKYIRLAQAGGRKSSRDVKNPVFLGLTDEESFPHQGHMDFVDNRFDPTTASMRARCVFRNTDKVLLPGMFAKIRIPGSAPYEAVLIPDSAVATDQHAAFVYVVVDGKIKRRTVVLGPIVNGLRVVREGLAGNESLVIQGLLQARPGVEVETEQGEIAIVEDGLPDVYQPITSEDLIFTKQRDSQPISPTAIAPTPAEPKSDASPTKELTIPTPSSTSVEGV